MASENLSPNSSHDILRINRNTDFGSRVRHFEYNSDLFYKELAAGVSFTTSRSYWKLVEIVRCKDLTTKETMFFGPLPVITFVHFVLAMSMMMVKGSCWLDQKILISGYSKMMKLFLKCRKLNL